MLSFCFKMYVLLKLEKNDKRYWNFKIKKKFASKKNSKIFKNRVNR